MDINMPRDKETGKPKGFAFLMYEDQRSTVLAVDNLNGATVLERTLRVDHVKNYKQPRMKGEDGEWMEPENQSLNAKPQLIVGACTCFHSIPKAKRTIPDDGALSDSSVSSAPSIDPEDPMRDYLLEKRREEKEKAKKSHKSKGKHKDETPEERRARKDRKRAKKARKLKNKSEVMQGVEALLSALERREMPDKGDGRRRSRSFTPDRGRIHSRSRSREDHGARRRSRSRSRSPGNFGREKHTSRYDEEARSGHHSYSRRAGRHD
jgi:RNA-binding motif protein, X-linked 2